VAGDNEAEPPGREVVDVVLAGSPPPAHEAIPDLHTSDLFPSVRVRSQTPHASTLPIVIGLHIPIEDDPRASTCLKPLRTRLASHSTRLRARIKAIEGMRARDRYTKSQSGAQERDESDSHRRGHPGPCSSKRDPRDMYPRDATPRRNGRTPGGGVSVGRSRPSAFIRASHFAAGVRVVLACACYRAAGAKSGENPALSRNGEAASREADEPGRLPRRSG
jgi:hypothetical protein